MRLFAVTFMICVAVLWFGPKARTQAETRRKIPVEAISPEDKLTLARALVGEADWHAPDHKAISWVLARRYRTVTEKYPTFASYIAKYSSALKSKTPRTKFIQALPWGDPPGTKFAAYTEEWSKVRNFVDAWAEGKIPDPCPRAQHFGGAMDRPGKDLKVIPCGLTKNLFYAQRRSAKK